MLKFLPVFFYQNHLYLDFPSRSDFRVSSKRIADLRHLIDLQSFNWTEPVLIPIRHKYRRSLLHILQYIVCAP